MQKIYQQYGDNVYRILKENPYKMAEDIAGVGFRTADEIAGKIGIAVDSEFRIKSGLSYVLNQATAEGHVYLPEPVLLRRGQELLGVEPERMQKSLQDMAIDKNRSSASSRPNGKGMSRCGLCTPASIIIWN